MQKGNDMINRKKKRPIPEQGPEGAKKAAVSLLAYREHTEKELLEKLIDRGFSREDARAAVDFTIEKSYLSEKRYYLRYAEFCARTKHFGKRRIAQEAKRKGFSAETVALYTAEALKDVDFDECCFEALLQIRHTTKEKMTATLLRRGFSAGNMRYAFEKYQREIGPLFQEASDDEEDDFDFEDPE